MAANLTATDQKVTMWQRIADAFAYVEQGSLERSDNRLRALEERVEALERKQGDS